MKKFIILIVSAIFASSLAQAEIGVNIGISASGAVYEVDGAKETVTSGNTRTTKATKDAEALVAIGSIFIEKELGDKFAIGVDYVPHSLESETARNEGNATNINLVQVDFEDLTTIYGTFDFNDNIYAKLGYMEVDAISNETLATGGKYGNATLDGYTVGLGYKRDFVSATFIRLEASYSEFDGVTLINTVDTSKRVTVDGLSGYGAKISVGKSF